MRIQTALPNKNEIIFAINTLTNLFNLGLDLIVISWWNRELWAHLVDSLARAILPVCQGKLAEKRNWKSTRATDARQSYPRFSHGLGLAFWNLQKGFLERIRASLPPKTIWTVRSNDLPLRQRSAVICVRYLEQTRRSEPLYQDYLYLRFAIATCLDQKKCRVNGRPSN